MPVDDHSSGAWAEGNNRKFTHHDWVLALISIILAAVAYCTTIVARARLHEDIAALITAGMLAAGAVGVSWWFARTAHVFHVRSLVVCTAAVALVFALQPSTLSRDIQDYVSCASVLVRGGNPYNTLCNVGRTFSYVYGPVYLFLSSIPVWVARGNDIGALAGLKFLTLVSHLANVWLVYRLGYRRWGPVGGLRGAALYALNPLVLFEGVQGAHNDTLMVSGLLAGLYMWQEYRQRGLALLWLITAGLVKFLPFLVIPFLGIEMWRVRKERVVSYPRFRAWGAGVALVLLIAFSLPFFSSFFAGIVWQTVNSPLSRLSTLGPLAFLLVAFSLSAGYPFSTEILMWVSLCVGGIVWWALVHALRQKEKDLLTIAGILFLCLIFFSPHFLVPWYILWLYPFVPLVFSPSRAPIVLMWLSLVGALSLIVPVFLALLLVSMIGVVVVFWRKQFPSPFVSFRSRI